MPKINQLTSINLRDLVGKSQAREIPKSSVETKKQDFGSAISDFIKTVNEDQKHSAGKVADVIQGKSQNLHEAMAALEESRLSFQLMVEVRNKLLESYKEIERMQI